MKLKATGSKAALLGAAAAMLAAVGVQAQALAEPPAGQFVFGEYRASRPGVSPRQEKDCEMANEVVGVV